MSNLLKCGCTISVEEREMLMPEVQFLEKSSIKTMPTLNEIIEVQLSLAIVNHSIVNNLAIVNFFWQHFKPFIS